MEIALLITKAEFTKDKLIANPTEEERINSSIREAQQMDLRPVLGDAMYYDLIKNYNSLASPINKYNKLIEGEEYTDAQNNPIIFSGLRMALKYWAYARYIAKQQVNVTAASLVTKTSPWSTPVEAKTVGIEVQSAKSGAVAYWEEAKTYLCAKSDSFPLWKGVKAKPRGGISITAVGGNQ